MSGADHDDHGFAEHEGAWSDWQAVSLGDRSIAEVEAARRARGDSPELVAHAEQLFRPYDEREREDLLDGLLAGLGKHGHGAEPTLVRTRSRSTKLAFGVLLSTAAALALWIMWPSDPAPPEVAPVPKVALVVEKAAKDTWGPESNQVEAYRFVPNGEFSWTLRPDTDAGEPFEAEVRAFVVDEGYEREIDLGAVVVTRSPKGAVKIEGRISELALEQARSTIVLIYGRPGEVTQSPRAAASLQDGDQVQVERVVIVVEPRPTL
ncbi:hypothetical protein ACNOYE_03085 [Nannocystaceae bacterium ST9]